MLETGNSTLFYKESKFSCREKENSKCATDASFVRQISHDNFSDHGHYKLDTL
jgi:hypothetical protein